MNSGGFSWRRFLGISAFKSRVSRKIGIPLTASGRRRKLGASIYNAVGPVAGTIAVAAIAAKQHETPDAATKPRRNAHFCDVKGVTHNNVDGTSRIAALRLCNIGDPVKLIADPSNIHDRNAIRVVLLTGEQIGFISARQAARFHGRLHLLAASVYSRVRHEWGNETIKLRITAKDQSDRGVMNESSPDATSLQTEANETGKKEGWQSTLIYFENPSTNMYQVLQSADTQLIQTSLQEGMKRVGFIGLKDAPKGIEFGLSLADGFPVAGALAKRFIVNAREWIVKESKDQCLRNGTPAPVVHDMTFSNEFKEASKSNARLGLAASIATLLFLAVLMFYQAWWAAGATVAIAFLIWRQATKA
jgi:hypothetical protein